MFYVSLLAGRTGRRWWTILKTQQATRTWPRCSPLPPSLSLSHSISLSLSPSLSLHTRDGDYSNPHTVTSPRCSPPIPSPSLPFSHYVALCSPARTTTATRTSLRCSLPPSLPPPSPLPPPCHSLSLSQMGDATHSGNLPEALLRRALSLRPRSSLLIIVSYIYIYIYIYMIL
jgi:hypothetical protein